MLTRSPKAWAYGLVFSVLCAAVVGMAAEEPEPTISAMEAMVAADPDAVSAEARDAAAEAKDYLKAKKPYDAKARLMRFHKFNAPTPAEYKLLDPIEEDADDALGEHRAKIEAEIAAALEKEYEAGRLISKYRENEKIREQQNQQMSKALADQAAKELYVENNPKRAEELARHALALDPKNQLAERVHTEARARQGKPGAELKKQYVDIVDVRHVLLESYLQEFASTKDKARKLYEEGKFGDSLETWRLAETYVDLLSAHADTQKDAEEVQKGLERAEKAYQEWERKLAATREQEARQKIEAAIADMDRLDAAKTAGELERVYSLIREKNYAEADRILKDIKYREPANQGAQMLDEILAHESHEYEMDEIRWRDEKEMLKTIEKTYERVTPYAELMDYPRKKVWEDIIKKRPGVLYPSKIKEYSEDEIEVIKHLDQKVSLRFDETPLRDVVAFLQEVTPVNFAVVQEDIPPDGGLITLHIDTKLRTALDQICSLAAMDWKVDGPVIKIANPERLKEYELRVYDIRDLLLNIEDKVAKRAQTLTESGDDDDDDDSDDFSSFEFGDDDDSGGGGTGDTSASADLVGRAESLRDVITSTVQPQTWLASGTTGSAPAGEGEEDGGGAWDAGGDAGWDAGGGGGGFDAGAGAAGPQGRAFLRRGNPGDLIIIQTAQVHAEVESLLGELRKAMHIQVNVEARFVEVAADFFEEVGFNFDRIDFHPKTPDDGDNDMGLSGGLPMFADAQDFGLNVNFSIFGGTHIEGLLRLLQSNTETKTLACPILTLMNGQRAFVSVSTTQSYVAKFETEEENFEPDIDQIADTITLDVRPIVSPDRHYVFLELFPIVTTVLGFDRFEWTSSSDSGGGDDDDGGGAVPVTNVIQLPRQLEQRIETTVCVPDRGVLMIGGLTRHEKVEQERGVPILNKIPILKRIFLSEGQSIHRSTLVVLVRPRIIIREEEESRAF